MIVLDWETTGIEGNPIVNPPDPVGLAYWVPGQKPDYLAWGHPEGNNIDRAEGLAYAQKLFNSGQPQLFHNAPFDLAVADKVFGRKWRRDNWSRYHDTQYLLFLDDPYASTLSLKPSAARYLGMDPLEQDAVKEWVLRYVAEATEKEWGAYISRAPGDLVGKYAVGDVVRTKRLFDLLMPKIIEEGMEAAYNRERQLMPILYESSRKGIRVNVEKMKGDYESYIVSHKKSANHIRDILKSPSLDFSKRGDLANALDSAGYVTDWSYTPTGRKSTSKKTLKINDPEVANLIAYHAAMATCLGTFMGPWLNLSKHDGRLHTSWNQVRTVERDSRGTQTGRLSSNGPNFQNVPNEYDTLAPLGYPNLPYMRQYLLPEEGHLWLKRDFSSQEVRILAHFEDGQLCEAYRTNPDLDPHQMARDMILQMRGVDYPRKSIKITGFSIIYGSGVPGLMMQLNSDNYAETANIKAAYLDAMPGVRDLQKEISNVGRSGGSIRTWGGRRYYCEPPKIIDGRTRTFEYKLLNYLIQGSAADQTKQSIIDWEQRRSSDTVFLATVHDEINISAPKDDIERQMSILREEMNKPRMDVPFTSEGFVGPNWFDIEETT